MNFYANRFSDRCRIAKQAVDKAGVQMNMNEMNLLAGDQKSEAHLKRNPNGLVPVMEEGDFTLYESLAIAKYVLDTKAPGNTLYPTDPKQRARVNMFLGMINDFNTLKGAMIYAKIISKMNDKYPPLPEKI